MQFIGLMLKKQLEHVGECGLAVTRLAAPPLSACHSIAIVLEGLLILLHDIAAAEVKQGDDG